MKAKFITQKALEKIKSNTQKAINRSLDRHVKLAVTGFSGSGKTAFITALVKHLTSQANKQNLPFFDVVREQRLIAAKQVPQRALDIPTFDYQSAISCLLADEPRWPPSTERINTLTLAIKFETKHGLKQHLSGISTLYLELIDYPGEWLADLPMMSQDYQTWSEAMLALLKADAYKPYSEEFLSLLANFDSAEQVDEQALKTLAQSYQQVLTALKKNTHLAQLQPGRMLIPGDLAGAPILLFFPVDAQAQGGDNSQYQQLKARFEAYKQQVVTPFYKQHFCQFDRQLVLVDALSALNDGPDTLAEQKEAIGHVMQVFNYGKSGLLKRLFYPKIDKVLFAANKCDHVSPSQQADIALLLNDMLGAHSNDLRFAGVAVDTMAISSVQSTQVKRVQENGQSLECVYGKVLAEDGWTTYLPPQPPNHCLSAQQWPEQGFEFLSFSPLKASKGELGHVRLDHALQFLIGDKLA
ncbi:MULTISPECIES: YcjX family protein [Pseudoalteromonas]|uniref:Nucleoside triphosphate hydrolase n=1 Tax=Pseudoalteromonas amylolytica TaxID=1859457 RepID=A0A1S1MYM8_9GAMM|nr:MULTISPECIES: YcjX family protein [Pseudoalteromonas]OHU87444.1 nucleoside triphosphate hydrolase [Pseudoalteromonas sp. JW3]OHU90886.1 nucleoside triphosphate hydrolase [Pseudoalteromonas amylolytica]